MLVYHSSSKCKNDVLIVVPLLLLFISPFSDTAGTSSAAYGDDILIYQISDGKGGTASAFLTVTVQATNPEPPVAQDDYVVTGQNIPITSNVIDGRAGGMDYDPNVLETEALLANPSLITNAAHGAVVLSANGDFTYTPNPGYSGIDSFVYEISDGNTGTDTATVTIKVGHCTDGFQNGDETNVDCGGRCVSLNWFAWLVHATALLCVESYSLTKTSFSSLQKSCFPCGSEYQAMHWRAPTHAMKSFLLVDSEL